VPKQIAKKDLSAADQRFDTQRARYLYLTKLGYSQARVVPYGGKYFVYFQ
jgi:hypothetical protein